MGAVYRPYEVNKKRICNKSLKLTKRAMVFNIQRKSAQILLCIKLPCLVYTIYLLLQILVLEIYHHINVVAATVTTSRYRVVENHPGQSERLFSRAGSSAARTTANSEESATATKVKDL